MRRRDRRSDKPCGFSRKPLLDPAADQTSVRHDHRQTENAAKQPPKGATLTTMSVTDDDRWTVRPKLPEPARANLSPRASNRRPTVRSHTFSSMPAAGPAEAEGSRRSKRLLALGLAGMAYLIGIVGLWSMVQSFNGNTSPSLTPAGDRTTPPPIDRSIDLRDAHLNDGIIRPTFRPDVILNGDDVAMSDIHDKI